MTYNILFTIVGIGLIALGLSLVKLGGRIQDLEERLEAHATELTEHHNKIDTLEINGSVYESLFEQQGLWGEDKE